MAGKAHTGAHSGSTAPGYRSHGGRSQRLCATLTLCALSEGEKGSAMAYHILPPPAVYRSRLVLCRQTGPLHRHEWHEETYTTALCGAAVVKDSGLYCELASFAQLADRVLYRPDLCQRCAQWAKEYPA